MWQMSLHTCGVNTLWMFYNVVSLFNSSAFTGCAPCRICVFSFSCVGERNTLPLFSYQVSNSNYVAYMVYISTFVCLRQQWIIVKTMTKRTASGRAPKTAPKTAPITIAELPSVKMSYAGSVI